MHVRVHDNGTGLAQEFETALGKQLGVLGLTAADVELLIDDPPSWPSHSLLLHLQDGPSYNPQAGVELQRALQEGCTVIPVIDTAATAETLPPQISHLNGFVIDRYKPRWAASLADEVLTRLWLQRPARKVFISYRRDETQAIAEQLFKELSLLGYAVFLDEAVIAAGRDFAAEIRWWLADADIVVLLASPSIGNSTWVRQEIDEANAWSIGVLAVCWRPLPDPLPPVIATLASHQRLLLKSAWSKGSPSGSSPQRTDLLNDAELRRMLDRIHVRRLSSVRRKLDDLLVDARDAHGGSARIQPGLRFGDFVVDADPLANNDPTYVRTVPFRPGPDTLQSLEDEVNEAFPDPTRSDNPKRLYCAYLESDPSDARAQSLRWCLERAPGTSPAIEFDTRG